MSAYGPALFVSRRDGAALPPPEREELLALTRAATAHLRLRNEHREPAEPRIYDYDGYEPGALGLLLYSGYGFGQLPEDLQADQQEAWSREGARVGAQIERQVPGVYTFVSYGVED